jgi:hypothetical protein
MPSANPNADPQQIRGAGGNPQTSGDPNVVGGTTSNTPSSNALSSQSGSNPSPVIGGGPIAGVASLSENSSIRLVKTYDEYDKWEFIFDFHSDPVAMAKAGGQQGNQPGNQQPGAQQQLQQQLQQLQQQLQQTQNPQQQQQLQQQIQQLQIQIQQRPGGSTSPQGTPPGIMPTPATPSPFGLTPGGAPPPRTR